MTYKDPIKFDEFRDNSSNELLNNSFPLSPMFSAHFQEGSSFSILSKPIDQNLKPGILNQYLLVIIFTPMQQYRTCKSTHTE